MNITFSIQVQQFSDMNQQLAANILKKSRKILRNKKLVCLSSEIDLNEPVSYLIVHKFPSGEGIAGVSIGAIGMIMHQRMEDHPVFVGLIASLRRAG